MSILIIIAVVILARRREVRVARRTGVHVVLVAAAEARSFLATHPTRRADELVSLVFVLYLPLDPSRLRSAVWAASRVVVGGDAAGRRGVHVRAASATWIAVA